MTNTDTPGKAAVHCPSCGAILCDPEYVVVLSDQRVPVCGECSTLVKTGRYSALDLLTDVTRRVFGA